MEAVKHKRRDRTGEVYGNYTIIKPTGKDKEWIARCSCGKERKVMNSSMCKLTYCNSCAGKIRMQKKKASNKKPEKDKFQEMKNWMSPKRTKFTHDAFYKIDENWLNQPVVGKLINEYQNTASFEIINWHESDKKALKEKNFRIAIKKKNAVEI